MDFATEAVKMNNHRAVFLANHEVDFAMAIAMGRQAKARGNGVQNAKISDRTDIEIEHYGAMAELAFAKMLNIYPALTLGYAAHDFNIPHHGKIDVKFTFNQQGGLRVKPPPGRQCDIYVLFTASPTPVVGGILLYCLGYLSGEVAIRGSREEGRNGNGRITYFTRQEDLLPIQRFLGIGLDPLPNE